MSRAGTVVSGKQIPAYPWPGSIVKRPTGLSRMGVVGPAIHWLVALKCQCEMRWGFWLVWGVWLYWKLNAELYTCWARALPLVLCP